MGWMRLSKAAFGSSSKSASRQIKGDLTPAVAHIETASPQTQAQTQVVGTAKHHYSFQSTSTDDADLPFISHKEVAKREMPTAVASNEQQLKKQDIWIVVNGIVYDCSEFISAHPGGEQVIWSFSGQDCSWQFWRFHDKALMEQFGRPLRIGRTSGVLNKYKEQPRYVGMASIGDDDWW